LKVLVPGECPPSKVLSSTVGLSFWGGVDANSAVVVEKNHPLEGEVLSGKVVCLPSGRGSCTASQVILELVLNGRGPTALILKETDELIALGFVVAEELFGVINTPVLVLDDHDTWQAVTNADTVAVQLDGSLTIQTGSEKIVFNCVVSSEKDELILSASDRSILAGDEGHSRRVALKIVKRIATMIGARELVDVVRAHIDAVTYIGPASLRFVQKFLSFGGQGFKVPTTTNACSVDLTKWRQLNIPTSLGEPAEKLANGYLELGAQPSFTCAPYLLDMPPLSGEHLGWSESNAVAFANSICGAKTLKNADFLDACIALTGRAPLAGVHLNQNRKPKVNIHLESCYISEKNTEKDILWPVAGYAIGLAANTSIPIISGALEFQKATKADLKHFSAAFATTSKVPLFYLSGHAPTTLEQDVSLPKKILTVDDLNSAWKSLGGYTSMNDLDTEDNVDLVAVGNPHASVQELEMLYALLKNQKRLKSKLIVTIGRDVLRQAEQHGLINNLLQFDGFQLIQDTCWCMLNYPIVPHDASIVTNSAKYAHYAPGLVRPRRIQISSLSGCVDAAVSGRLPRRLPPWSFAQRRYSSSLPLRRFLLFL